MPIACKSSVCMAKRILPNASIKLVWWNQRKANLKMAIFLSDSSHCKDEETSFFSPTVYHATL